MAVELTISAKNGNWFHGPTRLYAVVWVDPKNKSSTKVDEEGDIFRYRDDPLIITLPGPINDDTTLFIDIVHAGNEEDTKEPIASTRLKLKEVLNEAGYGKRVNWTIQLKQPSGRLRGKVDVKVLIREPGRAPPAPGALGIQEGHASQPPPVNHYNHYQPPPPPVNHYNHYQLPPPLVNHYNYYQPLPPPVNHYYHYQPPPPLNNFGQWVRGALSGTELWEAISKDDMADSVGDFLGSF